MTDVNLGELSWLDEPSNLKTSVKQGFEQSGPLNFFLRDGEQKVVIVTTGMPWQVYVHNTYGLNGLAKQVLCLNRNNAASNDECPLCMRRVIDKNGKPSNDTYATRVGYFGVIDCGHFQYTNGKLVLTPDKSKDGTKTYQFDRKVAAFPFGSPAKPGLMHRIQQSLVTEFNRNEQPEGAQMTAKWSLWEVSRKGEKSNSLGDWNLRKQYANEDEVKAALLRMKCEESKFDDPETSVLRGFQWSKEIPPLTLLEMTRLSALKPQIDPGLERLQAELLGKSGLSVAAKGQVVTEDSQMGEDDIPF